MTRETRNLLIFFAATFAWTWACYLPIAISGHSPYEMPWTILLIAGGAGPSIMGVAMVLLTYDAEQRRDYWRRCFSVRRIGARWWAAIGLILPGIVAASVLLDMALGGAAPGMDQLKGLAAQPAMWPLAIFLSFMSGPWSEEFGWRGYTLGPLLDRFGAVRGSVGLGILWGVWHLPLFFMPATWHSRMGFQLAGFWTFIAFNIGLSLIMTWVYRNTGRSILSAMLLHFASNFSAQLVAPSSDRVEVFRAALVLLIGLAGCALARRKP